MDRQTDEAPPRQTVRRVLEVLRRDLGDELVLTSPEAIARYRGFVWTRPRPRVPVRFATGTPSAVVRPRTVQDVVAVLRQASAAGIPVVPYGGGSGVMGGALPIANGIVLDVGALNRILSISPSDRIAHVEAGVILADLATAAEAQGLLFAHDPWSQPIATIGGAIGTNGVGYLAAGYGAMGDQVRGLEAVLPDGEIIRWAGAAKGTGPDLWRLFVGAEGTLGVVTSAVVQLFPLPEARVFAAFRFPTFADGFRAIVQLGAVGLKPSMVDYEEVDGPPLHSPADLHLAFDGPREVVRAAVGRAERLAEECGGANLGAQTAEDFWEHRHASSEWFLRRTANVVAVAAESARPARSHGTRYLDVAVPTSSVLDYCGQVVATARRHGVDVHSFGIWARPELVSFILEGPSEESGTGPLEHATDEVLRLARKRGGSIEYCHGAGVRIAHLLPEELGAAHDLLRRVKGTLDPSGILNPGKLGL